MDDNNNINNYSYNNSNYEVPDPLEGSSSLDHALLESLFYNEMALMAEDDGNNSSTIGIEDYTTGNATTTTTNITTTNDNTTTYDNNTNTYNTTTISSTALHPPVADPLSVMAEQEMLHDFGVVMGTAGSSGGNQINNNNNNNHTVTATPSPLVAVPAPAPISANSISATTTTSAPHPPTATVVVPTPSQRTLPATYNTNITHNNFNTNTRTTATTNTFRLPTSRGIRHNVVVPPANITAATATTTAQPIIKQEPILKQEPTNTTVVASQTTATIQQQNHQSHQPTIQANNRVSNNNRTMKKTPTVTKTRITSTNTAASRNNNNVVTAVTTTATSIPPSAAAAVAAVAANTNATPATSTDRTKLVSQFATLAERLGITLPPQVLQKLTQKTTTTTTTATATATANTTTANNNTEAVTATTTAAIKPPSSQNTILQQIQSTAMEAVAAVTSSSSGTKRRSPSEDGEGGEANATNTASRSYYSKRKKKPRLVDCERRLEELKNENDVLKRHLNNILNQSYKLENERTTVENQMKQMYISNAPQIELEKLIQHYTDVYSDFGKKRHEELNFHLQQLQRLATPTNFTKMGLFTLGGGVGQPVATAIRRSSNEGINNNTNSTQNNTDNNNVTTNNNNDSSNNNNNNTSNSSSNPIAGILQKELQITNQQGRKILEQRQKIQNICSNLKECLILLGKLKSVCEQKTKIFHDRITKCREILTPKQVVQLLLWINENSTTLGTVCPGWGSELQE